MKGVQFLHYGFKLLISITCLVVALYQCIELFNNYNAKETIQKSTEVFIHEDIPTPQIIICTDPPHHDTVNNIIKIAKYEDKVPQVRNLKTTFKGICNIIETSKMGKEEFAPSLCFNSSRKLLVYTLFPGQKIFVSLFHPHKAIKPTIITGHSLFKAIANGRIVQKIANDQCISSGTELFSAIELQQSYELCMMKKLREIGRTVINITYHPIFENYEEFENMTEDEGQGMQSNISHYILHAFNACIKPCTEVFYSLDVDTFFLKPDELEIFSEGKCDLDSGIISLQFSRIFTTEVEDYIIKSVDLLSGFGGAIGLWLGWSAMTLGDIVLEAVKTFINIPIMK